MLLVSGYCVGQEGFLFSNAKPVQSVKLSVGNVRAGLCSSNLKFIYFVYLLSLFFLQCPVIGVNLLNLLKHYPNEIE